MKKFTIGKTTYIFIESEGRIIVIYNDKNNNKVVEYTVNTIISMPETEERVRKILSLDIWYPIDNII